MSEETKAAAWDTYGLDQAVVEGWVRRTFGDKVMDNPKERAMRVLEEAVETAQATGIERGEVLRLVGVVFGKPPGDLQQEVGGLVVTLLALCAHHNFRLDEIARRELERILSRDRDELRRKQEGKSTLGVADRPE